MRAWRILLPLAAAVAVVALAVQAVRDRGPRPAEKAEAPPRREAAQKVSRPHGAPAAPPEPWVLRKLKGGGLWMCGGTPGMAWETVTHDGGWTVVVTFSKEHRGGFSFRVVGKGEPVLEVDDPDVLQAFGDMPFRQQQNFTKAAVEASRYMRQAVRDQKPKDWD